jgi:RimJ/RimL family protein N-acetyltransferase
MTPVDLLAGLPPIDLENFTLRGIPLADVLRAIEMIDREETASVLFREAHFGGGISQSLTGAIEEYERHRPPPWGAYSRSDGLLAGICSILEWNIRHSAVEILPLLFPRYRTATNGVEIVRGMADFAFRCIEANRVWLPCDPADAFTSAAAAGAGLGPEAHLEEYLRIGDGYHDITIFTMTRDEWAPSSAE